MDVPVMLKELISKGYSSIFQTNEGYRNIMGQIQALLDGYDNDVTMYFLSEVFSDYVIYEVASKPDTESFVITSKFYKRSYTLDVNGQVVLSDDTKEVIRKIVYDEIKAHTIKYKRKDDATVDKEKLAILVQSGVFVEADGEWLAGLDAEHLDKLVTVCTKKVETTQTNEAKVDIPAVVQALAEQFKTPEQYIQLMPAEMRDQMESGLRLHKEQRQAVIDKIKAYNVFTEEELQKKSLEELTKISRLIPTAHDYSLAGARAISTNTVAEDVLLPIGIKAKA